MKISSYGELSNSTIMTLVEQVCPEERQVLS